MKLDDQFEWDLENENASPEEFAEVYAQDLGLNGEFRWVIHFGIYMGQRLTSCSELLSRTPFASRFRPTKNHCSLLAILPMELQC
jgi:hypothetical protein